MQVSINVTLDQEDIDQGLTATDAVYLAFPNVQSSGPVTVQLSSPPVQDSEASINNELNNPVDTDEKEYVRVEDEFDSGASALTQNTVEDTPLAGASDTLTHVDVDSAGVPWNKDLHSSNKKLYADGNAEAGRWMWKKGSNKETREAEALALVASPKSVDGSAAGAPVSDAGPQADTSDVLSTESAPVSPGVAAAPAVGFPTAENAAPVENSPAAPAQIVTPVTSEGGITWPDFVKAVTAKGITTDQLNEQLARHGLDQMALLSPGKGPMDNPQRIEIATALGFIA
jgi:hypothetical protein